MIHTFEARLPVDDVTATLLTDNAAHWSFGLRKAWSLLYRERLPKPLAYAGLKKLGFTSEQVGSLLIAAEMKVAALDEVKKREREQLMRAIAKRKAAITAKSKKIVALTKRLARLQKQHTKLTPRGGEPRTPEYTTVLRHLREVAAELAFCQNWVRQKSQVLVAKEDTLKALQAAMATHRYALCFGSKKLLAQRPSEHNADTTPFTSLESWRAAWDTARNGQWWSVGKAAKPQGNAELQWLPDTQQLRLRLTDQVADARMLAAGVPLEGGNARVMSQRMACRFIVIDGVDFTSHRGAARTALLEAFGRLPVTMRVLKCLGESGEVAWYVQASVEVETGYHGEAAATRTAGVLGTDLNARGVAWCAVKPDGNRLVVAGVPQRGFIPWDLRGKHEAERQQIIGTVTAQVGAIAHRLKVAVALENLDFSAKKAGLKAGAVDKRYNEMLSGLASAQYSELLARRCEKLGLTTYKVNPLYSSVGGFVKYGRLNRCTADEAAAHWLARQALYGTVWKTEGATQFVKKKDEKLVFPHLPAIRMQRMKDQAGVQWKDVSWGLGSRRQHWGRRFHAWFDTQVGTTPPAAAEPVLEDFPPGWDGGFQPDRTSASGGSMFAAG